MVLWLGAGVVDVPGVMGKKYLGDGWMTGEGGWRNGIGDRGNGLSLRLLL